MSRLACQIPVARRPRSLGALAGALVAAVLAAPAAGVETVASLGTATTAQPAEQTLKGRFRLSIGGMRAAELRLDGTLSNGRYSVDAYIGTQGMVQRLWRAAIEASVEGTAGPGGLAPGLFRSRSTQPDETRDVEIAYRAGVPSVSVEPAYDAQPWQLDPTTQTDALDPLSGVMAVFASRPLASLCNREVRIFDARRRFAVSLGEASKPSAQGTVTCRAEYRRLGGFKPKLMGRPPFPFTVTFRREDDGLWHLQRAYGETPVGPAVIARVD